MRKSHFVLFGVAAITLGFVATAPASAGVQDEVIPEPVPEPAQQTTATQQAEIATWPAEKQTAYTAWPVETQGYYWTLSPDRQSLFWRLQDEDKIAITAMTGPEREAAWKQIESAFADPGDG